MKLTEELLKINIPNLTIKYLGDKNIPYQYILSTNMNKVVAIGWKIEDAIEDEKYYLYDKAVSFAKECEKTDLLNREELYSWQGLIFVINSKNIWTCPFNLINHAGNKENTFDNFLEYLKKKFPELKTESETLTDKLQNSENNTKELERLLKKLEEESKQQVEKIKKLEDKSKRDEQNLAASNELLKEEKEKIAILEKTNMYLSQMNKTSIVEKLTKKQIEALLKIMSGSYSPAYSGFTLSLNNLEVNLDLCHPNLIVKIPSTQREAYSTASDYICFPTCIYKLIQTNGTTNEISTHEISSNPNAIFDLRGLWLVDLQGCTSISVDDLTSKNNG